MDVECHGKGQSKICKQSRRLLVFIKYPTPGKVKTRLIPALGAEKAADLYRQMAEHTFKLTQSLADEIHIQLRCDGADEEHFRRWLAADIDCIPSGNGDLGERMLAAFQENFDPDVQSVVIIGTDCPGLEAKHVTDAFDLLKDNDLVLGPSSDGGYYLIGLSQCIESLFRNVLWGQQEVFETTIRVARLLSLKTAILEELGDVDRPEDLPLCERAGLFVRDK